MTTTANPAVAAAVHHLRDGQRDQAVRLLTRAHRDDPADYRVAHALALMTLWALVNRGGRSGGGRSGGGRSGRVQPADWHVCLGLWASLLADPRFWTWFAEDAAHRYQAEVPSTQVDGARGRLEQWLADTVARCAGDGVAALLTLEMRAARVVAVRGGLATGAGHHPIPGGPLLVQQLGLQQACHKLTAGLWASRDPQTQRCAMYFSQLGPARVLLDTGAPTAALASLTSLQCDACRRLDTSRSGTTGQPRVCRSHCRVFDQQNPAYAHRKDKGRRFLADAVALTVEAHLSIATAAVASADLDLPTAQKHWAAAVQFARTRATSGQIRQHVEDFVLRRVRFLQKSRRDDAIALLEALPLDPDQSAADELLGDAARKLSELLAQRGVDFANRKPAELDRAAVDLRRAARLNPASWYACRNLVIVLQNAAGRAADKSAPTGAELGRAATLLTEAMEELTRFRSAAPGNESADLFAATSTFLAGVLNGQAVRAHERGAYDEALRIIDRALQLTPGDRQIQQNRQVISEMKRTQPAIDALERGDIVTALRLLDDAVNRNPGDAGIRQIRDSVRAQYESALHNQLAYYGVRTRSPVPSPSWNRGGAFRRAARRVKQTVQDWMFYLRYGGW